MKIIVTHTSPDLDAICAVWLIKRFLPGWEEAVVRFVPSGERLKIRSLGDSSTDESFRGPVRSFPPVSAQSSLNLPSQGSNDLRAAGNPPTSATPDNLSKSPPSPIEKFDGNEVVHVDTGLGPLDHHSTPNENISASSLTLGFIKQQSTINEDKLEAIERIVEVVTDIDHFKEALWENPTAYYHDFSVLGILDGLKLQKPNNDNFYVEFISQCLDAILHDFENRVWAQKEIAEKGQEFETKWGKGLGVETVNDSVIKLAQKMGYVVVVRRDPRKGYVRIKARPSTIQNSEFRIENSKKNIDLTLVYEKLKKMDPQASWFFHVSKKMLLNGSVKNPKMRPSRLTLEQIIQVLEKI